MIGLFTTSPYFVKNRGNHSRIRGKKQLAGKRDLSRSTGAGRWSTVKGSAKN
jgi:hypothetical protein